jgi:hypothetical protein
VACSSLTTYVVRMSKVSLSILRQECRQHISPFIGIRLGTPYCSEPSVGYTCPLQSVWELRSKRTNQQSRKSAHTNIKFNKIFGTSVKISQVSFVKKHATVKTIIFTHKIQSLMQLYRLLVMPPWSLLPCKFNMFQDNRAIITTI